MENSLKILGWVVLITLALAIARQLSEQRTLYDLPDSWGVEYSQKGWDHGKESFANQSPADLTPREPYSLLDNSKTNPDGGLTAKTCYEKDFARGTDKTGNYIQRSNNYKHETPDSCSAPLTELATFYTGV